MRALCSNLSRSLAPMHEKKEKRFLCRILGSSPPGNQNENQQFHQEPLEMNPDMISIHLYTSLSHEADHLRSGLPCSSTWRHLCLSSFSSFMLRRVAHIKIIFYYYETYIFCEYQQFYKNNYRIISDNLLWGSNFFNSLVNYMSLHGTDFFWKSAPPHWTHYSTLFCFHFPLKNQKIIRTKATTSAVPHAMNTPFIPKGRESTIMSGIW